MTLVLNLLSLVALAALIYFAIRTERLSQDVISLIRIPFLVIVLLGTGLFMYGYHEGPLNETNFISLFVRSFISSLEMFVSETHLDEIVLERGKDFLGSSEGKVYLTLFFIIYPAALVVSFITIVTLVSRGIRGRVWMCLHRTFNNPQYIFWGVNSHSIAVANSLMAGGGKNGTKVNPDDIIFVDHPGNNKTERFSFVSFVKSSVSSEKRLSYELKNVSGRKPVVLLARNMIYAVNSSNLRELLSFAGLKMLFSRFKDADTEVFLLDDDENLNLQVINAFLGAGCTESIFYCHAGKRGLVSHFDDAVSSCKVHFVDSASLAVRELMMSENGTFHPARFVDVATNEDGIRLGYINGEFNAALVGFGRIGQEALRFLYEFGSFPGKDGHLAPSKFHVFDGRMNEILIPFMEKNPGASYETEHTHGRIVFHPSDSGSPEFHAFLQENIDRLNYFVIATGDDDNNLSISLDLLDYAFRFRKNGLKNFIVLARVTHPIPEHALERAVIGNYRKLSCDGTHLGIFGQDENVWTYDTISDKWINSKARIYYEAYQEASGEDIYDANGVHCWDARVENSKKGGNLWENKRRLEAQEEQDRHNCFHSATKRLLGNDDLYGRELYILPKYSEKIGHYSNPEVSDDTLAERAFEYLAIGEHLRWVSAYEMSGYIAPPDGTTRDYLKKWHEYILPYSDLPEKIKHYDWIPVKIAFAMKK